MTYFSVKNTANNNKLIRAEERELLLCLGLIFGFFHDESMAKQLYDSSEWDLRLPQFTYIPIPRYNSAIVDMNKDFWPIIDWTTKMAFHRYKHYDTDNMIYLYSTKRLRIYRERLEYGRNKNWRLDKTYRYLWTPAFLVYLMLGYNPQELTISLKDFYFIEHAENKEATVDYLIDYFKRTCDLVLVKNEEADAFILEKHNYDYIIFRNEDAMRPWLIAAFKELNKIHEKLQLGNYLSDRIRTKEKKHGEKNKKSGNGESSGKPRRKTKKLSKDN